MIKELRLIILLVSGSILYSCSTRKMSLHFQNLDKIYDPYSTSIHPDIQIYNDSDSSSLVVIKIKSQELLYNLANEENKLLSKIRVSYTLYDPSKKEAFIDSLSASFRLIKCQIQNYHLINLSVPTTLGRNYIIELRISDQNRRSSINFIRQINRIENYTARDFLISNPVNNDYHTDNYIREGQRFSFSHYNHDIDSMYVFYYKNNFITPKPPYITDTISESFSIADTVFTCYADSIDYSCFNNEGIYFFSSSMSTHNGFYLYNFGNNFPEFKKPSDLIKPLSYLSIDDSIVSDTLDEKMIKLELDNFWLSRAKNMDRSRELIKVFYSRVKYANYYFTSYKPGWQTDRGMIYIIYGSPDYILKTINEEQWIYNPSDIWPGNVFVFENIQHKFSRNHYVLNRLKQKSTGWDDAVKLWNSGEVYYYQNQ